MASEQPAPPARPGHDAQPVYAIELCEHTSRLLQRLEVAVPRERLSQLLSELLAQELSDQRRSSLLPLLLQRVAREPAENARGTDAGEQAGPCPGGAAAP